jgi:hypothetical protein
MKTLEQFPSTHETIPASMSSVHVRGLDEIGFESSSPNLKSRARFPVGARDRLLVGVIRGESVVPLSEGINKGIVNLPGRNGVMGQVRF